MEHVQPVKYSRVSLLAFGILIVLIWGFYKTYFTFFPSFEGFIFVQHFHGVMMLLWMACLIIQPLLISQKKFHIHKAVGKISYLLAPLLMVSIFLVSKMTFHRTLSAPSPLTDAVAGISLSIPGLLIFAALYSLAIANKKRTYNHMRYMIGTALLMIGPGLGRGLGVYFGMPGPISVTVTLAFMAFMGLLFLVADLVKRTSYVPNLVVTSLLFFQLVIWELRYHTVWQAVGEPFAKLLF